MRVISRFAAAIFFIASPVLAQEDTAEAQRNPFAGDSSAIAAGKALFDRACQNCHGPAGSGDRGPALTGAFRRGDTDGMIFTNGLTLPPGIFAEHLVHGAADLIVIQPSSGGRIRKP